MLGISVQGDTRRSRRGIALRDTVEYGFTVILGDDRRHDQHKWIHVDERYPIGRISQSGRIFEFEVTEINDPLFRHRLLAPVADSDLAFVRFDMRPQATRSRDGYVQKYWGQPQRLTRATVREGGTNWEDVVFVMEPGDAVFVHPARQDQRPYIVEWNGTGIECRSVTTFNTYVIRPWLETAQANEVCEAIANARRRNHRSLKEMLELHAHTV